MTAINPVTELTHDGEIAIITLNSPPVNALSAQVRAGPRGGFHTGQCVGCQGHRAHLRRADLHCRSGHFRVRQSR